MISYRFAKIEDANQIADIHLQAFEDFFLTSLGLGFLKLYYKSAINFKGATTICAINENNKIIGFSMGSIISTNFHKKLILSNKLGFFIRVIIILFSNPKALNRLKKNLQKKADPNDDGDYAELLSIGVLPEFKGLGVGKGLLIEFERAVLNAGALLQNVNASPIDTFFGMVSEPLTDYQKADIKKKFARYDHLNSAEQKMRMIAWDISYHFRDNWQGRTPFKGQLVCDKKANAVKYKEYLDEIGIVSCEVLISSIDEREGEESAYEKSIEKEHQFWKKMMDEHGNLKNYEKNIIGRFKNQKDPEIIIVVDKLLTGFDEPKLHTLFLDKEIRGINAIQTISRVNRTTKYKNDCKIIDLSYKNVNVKNIKLAFEHFSNVVVSDFDPLGDEEKLEIYLKELKENDLFIKHFKSFQEYNTTNVDINIILAIDNDFSRFITNEKKEAKKLKKIVSAYFKILNLIEFVIELDKKYSEELSMAAAQMESLNSLYKVQLESASRNAEANKEIADNAAKLKEQMQSMTSNIASLNAVYGGMLTAMSNR